MILLVGQVAVATRRSARRSRRSTTAAMFGAAGEVGRADRPRRAHSRVRRARLRDRLRGPARARRARAARGHARRRRPTSPDAQPFHVVQPHPGAGGDRRACATLLAARRAAARARRRRRLDAARVGATCARSSRRTSCPAGAAFRRQDCVDNDSPSYAGDVGIGINPKLAPRVRDADLLLVVGPRLGEMTTSRLHAARRRRRRGRRSSTSIPDAEELGRVYRPALADRLRARRSSPRRCATLRVELALARLDAARRAPTTERPGGSRRRCPATLDLGEVMAYLRERLPPTRSSRNGAGNFSVWAHRFYAVLAATARSSRRRAARWATACRRRSRRSSSHPERTVVCFAGDGDFLMNGQELATAVQYELPIVVLVVNNGMYGTIRMHQERHYPGPRRRHRPRQPGLRGARARVRRARRDGRASDEFAGAFERALARACRRWSSCASIPRRSRRARR